MKKQDIEAGMSPNGGFTRAQLAKWGVPWPPPKGWRKRLEAQGEKEQAHEHTWRYGVCDCGHFLVPRQLGFDVD